MESQTGEHVRSPVIILVIPSSHWMYTDGSQNPYLLHLG